MKALVKTKREPGIWLEQVPVPEIKVNEVLIKIKKTAICGTDLHIYKWDEWAQKTIPTPMHVGHEFIGEIVQIGSNVTHNLSIGDRVSGEGHIICGTCRNCRAGQFHLCPNTIGVGVNRPGAFAEYLAIPAFNVFKLPDYISDNIASILDPFGNAAHTALSFNLIGEDILITGAGPIGCMAVAICKKVGAKNVVITDINDYRLGLAKEMGADAAINVSDCKNSADIESKIRKTMHELQMEEGFDVGLEMSGVEVSIHAMVDLMINGGKIAMLGISGKNVALDWDKVVFKSLLLKGIYGREMFETWYKMSSLVKSGLDINKIITHTLPISEYLTGFELMKSGKCGKVILDWTV
ncbi:MAG: L-threonine 3-dehydrogenase [Proteobacteria bacterium]|jgi:threonine 3-dehydrogenase|nr:L-threonine 3-dehydrogenase [Pseudomonadota bacterium]